MKLSDRTLISHIYPLTLLDEIDRIIIIRDFPGPYINKVNYVCPPKWSLEILPLAFFIKFCMMVFLSIKEKPTLYTHTFYFHMDI